MLARLYDSTQSCVRLNGQDSSFLSVTTGMPEGCMAAPELFNFMIDNVMFRVMGQISHVWLKEYQLTDLEYVDDNALFAESVTDIPTVLKIYSKEAAQIGIRVKSGQNPN